MGHQIWKPVPSVLKIGKGRMVIMAYESALFLELHPVFYLRRILQGNLVSS